MECSVSTSGSSSWLRGLHGYRNCAAILRTMLPNVGIGHVSGMICNRIVTKRVV